MKLIDCEVGSEVTFRYGSFLIRGFVCLKDAEYSGGETHPLVGYTDLPTTHSQWWEDNSNSRSALALRAHGCVAGWMFLPDTKVDMCTIFPRPGQKKVSAGMKCSGPCKDFNQWAEPNMPDGTYKCYGCRKH